jgi:hypothetical protein
MVQSKVKLRLLRRVCEADAQAWHNQQRYLLCNLVHIRTGLAAVPQLLGEVTQLNCSSSSNMCHNVLVAVQCSRVNWWHKVS